MKMITKTLLSLAISTMSIGGAVGLGVAANNERNKVPMVAEASSNGYVFVDISSTSNYKNGVWCHNWGTSGTTWPGTKMTKLHDNIYYCQLKSASNNMIIFNNNNGKQTGDLSFNASGNGRLFYMDSDTTAHADDKTKNQMDYIVGASSTPSSSTTRLFIHHDDASNWKSNSSVTRIRCWGSGSYLSAVDAYVYDLTWNAHSDGTGASDLYYGFADVPADITGWQLIRTSSYAREIWNTCDGSVTGSFSSRIWRLKENNWNFSWNSNTGDSAAGTELMQAIISAYDTCSSSAINGYGAYATLKSNFFDHITSEAAAASATSLGGTSMAISQHIAGMARRPASLPGSNIIEIGSVDNTATIISFTVITSILVSMTCLYFLKKKRLSK